MRDLFKPRDYFIDDLLSEHEIEVHQCLQMGAHKGQIDFTEARLALKIGSKSYLRRHDASAGRKSGTIQAGA